MCGEAPNEDKDAHRDGDKDATGKSRPAGLLELAVHMYIYLAVHMYIYVKHIHAFQLPSRVQTFTFALEAGRRIGVRDGGGG